VKEKLLDRKKTSKSPPPVKKLHNEDTPIGGDKKDEVKVVEPTPTPTEPP